MADTTTVECGACGKRFRVRPDQLNHTVQCPHCKTPTTVKGPSAAETAAAEMFGAPAPQPSGHEKHLTSADIFGPGPLTAPHKSHLPGAHGSHRPAAHGAAGHRPAGHATPGHGAPAPGENQPPMPRRSSNTVPLIIIGAGAGVLVLILIIVGLTSNYRASTPVAPERATTSGPVVAPPVKTAAQMQLEKEERDRILLGKVGETPATTVEATVPATAAATSTEAAPPEPPRKTVGGVVVDDVGISVELMVGGFVGERLTYVAGHVTNGTGKPIRVLRVTVPILDRDTKKEMGQAVGTILGLGPGQTAPYIAEWEHEEGVMGSRGTATCQIDPLGSVQGLPLIEAKDAVAFPDPNTISASGLINVIVTNRGVLPVSQVELIGVLCNKDGKIVGASKGSVKANLAPNKPQKVTLRWTQCAGSKVDSAEVWAQAAP